jgi:hypothetical protein
MVEVIGFGTICGLIWLLASAMANESDAEKRRDSAFRTGDRVPTSKAKHAA